jgi:hypothetical protein
MKELDFFFFRYGQKGFFIQLFIVFIPVFHDIKISKKVALNSFKGCFLFKISIFFTLFFTHHSAFCSSPIQALPTQLTACNAVTCQYRAFKIPLFKLVDIHRKTIPVPLKYPDLIGKLADKKTSPFIGSKPSLLRTSPESELIPKRISVGSLYIKYLVEPDRASIREAF